MRRPPIVGLQGGPRPVHRLQGRSRAWVLVNYHGFDFTPEPSSGNRIPNLSDFSLCPTQIALSGRV
jgi:hypothetical protein